MKTITIETNTALKLSLFRLPPRLSPTVSPPSKEQPDTVETTPNKQSPFGPGQDLPGPESPPDRDYTVCRLKIK